MEIYSLITSLWFLTNPSPTTEILNLINKLDNISFKERHLAEKKLKKNGHKAVHTLSWFWHNDKNLSLEAKTRIKILIQDYYNHPEIKGTLYDLNTGKLVDYWTTNPPNRHYLTYYGDLAWQKQIQQKNEQEWPSNNWIFEAPKLYIQDLLIIGIDRKIIYDIIEKTNNLNNPNSKRENYKISNSVFHSFDYGNANRYYCCRTHKNINRKRFIISPNNNFHCTLSEFL